MGINSKLFLSRYHMYNFFLDSENFINNPINHQKLLELRYEKPKVLVYAISVYHMKLICYSSNLSLFPHI